jgi:hypothetical protein
LLRSYNFIGHNQLFGIDGSALSPAALTFQALGTTSRRFFYESLQDANIYRTGNGFRIICRCGATSPFEFVHDGKRLRQIIVPTGTVSQTNTNPVVLSQPTTKQKQDSTLISWSVGNGVRPSLTERPNDVTYEVV